MSLTAIFFWALGAVVMLLLLVVVRIVIDIKRSSKTRQEYVELEIDRFVNSESNTPVGKRILCSNCKLQKWFTEGVDGNIVVRSTENAIKQN
jgi:hypothetical protein